MNLLGLLEMGLITGWANKERYWLGGQLVLVIGGVRFGFVFGFGFFGFFEDGLRVI